ncbi:uncharacterized protein [Dermacentor albipictus]|uniref:uncharacterized protein isoform X3 n=1 Tax=Dermacentor albipictus TaxID=60249 RepID=UPI0038FC1218
MYSPEEPTTRAAAAAGSGNRQHGHCSAVAWPDYRFEALRCRPRVQPARHAAASVDDDELPHGRVQQRRGGNAKQLPSEATHEFFSSSVPARQCGSTTAFQHQGPPIGNASTLLESGNDFAYLSPVILPTARQHMRTFVHVHNVHDCAAARSCTALVAKDIKPGPAASLFSGHGGTTRKATMGLRTLFFIVQVAPAQGCRLCGGAGAERSTTSTGGAPQFVLHRACAGRHLPGSTVSRLLLQHGSRFSGRHCCLPSCIVGSRGADGALAALTGAGGMQLFAGCVEAGRAPRSGAGFVSRGLSSVIAATAAS